MTVQTFLTCSAIREPVRKLPGRTHFSHIPRSSEERLGMLGFPSLKKRKLIVTLIALCNFLRRGSGERHACLVSLVNNMRHRNGPKMQWRRFRLDVTYNIFTVRVVIHQNGLPRGVFDATCLSVFKRHLDIILNNMF